MSFRELFPTLRMPVHQQRDRRRAGLGFDVDQEAAVGRDIVLLAATGNVQSAAAAAAAAAAAGFSNSVSPRQDFECVESEYKIVGCNPAA